MPRSAEPSPELVRDASFLSHTVPRSWVHRRAVSEVFVTGVKPAEPTSSGTCTAFAQLPRAHAFFDAGPGHDPVLLAEVVRQVGLATAHRALGVPLGHQFLMWDLWMKVPEGGIPTTCEPTELVIDVTSQAHPARAAGPLEGFSRTDLSFAVHRDGSLVGSATLGFDAVPTSVYRQIRPAGSAEHSPEHGSGESTRTISAEQVGRRTVDDVIIERDGRGRMRLVPCRQHPILYDHVVDHVPGIVLIEAMRQAVSVVSGTVRQVEELHMRFRRYVEHDQPCGVEVLPSAPDDRTSRIRLVQGGVIAAEGEIRRLG